MLVTIGGLNCALAVYSATVPDFVRTTSASVSSNMLLILGWVGLVVVASFLEAIVVRGLLSRGGWRGRLEFREVRSDQPRPWRDWNLSLTIALAVLLGLNMLVFDLISRGFFVSEQRSTDAVTRMRSDDPEVRLEGIQAAARLPSPRVRAALSEIIGVEGPHRARAAWALGRIGPGGGTAPLVRLLSEGDREERAAAAIALGRLRQERLTAAVAPRLTGPDEPVEAYLVGLGLLGDRHATLPIVELMLDERTAPDHLAVAAWALGRIGDHRACPLLAETVTPRANPLSCAAAAAVGRLRCRGAAEPLAEAFDGATIDDRCEARASTDTDGSNIELWSTGLYRVVLVNALSRSSGAEATEWLTRVARDPRQVPQVREVAASAAALDG